MKKATLMTRYLFKGPNNYYTYTIIVGDRDLGKQEFESDCFYLEIFEADCSEDTLIETSKQNVEFVCIGSKMSEDDIVYIYGQDSSEHRKFLNYPDSSFVLVLNKYLVVLEEFVKIVPQNDIKLMDKDLEMEYIEKDIDIIM